MVTYGDKLRTEHRSMTILGLTFPHVIHKLLNIAVPVGFDSLQFSEMLDTW